MLMLLDKGADVDLMNKGGFMKDVVNMIDDEGAPLMMGNTKSQKHY